MTRTHIAAAVTDPLEVYDRLRARRAAFLFETRRGGRRRALVGGGTGPVSVDEAERALARGIPVAGYLGYDHAARLEPVPMPPAGADTPESGFVLPQILLRMDAGGVEVLAGDAGEAEGILTEPPAGAEGLLATPPAGDPPSRSTDPRTTTPSRAAYLEMAGRALRHIEDGDVLQVVLSLRLERPAPDPAGLYRVLRRLDPSPYGFVLELGDVALVGASPETLVRLEDGRAVAHPIAGTTARGPGDAERLLRSEKDRAEHVMLVDLARNDLARVCLPGSIRVSRLMRPERCSHVAHLVSEVTGVAAAEASPFDVLRACFPAGTVTGAPKVRAMQLISELEGVRRGPYAGAVGYALPDGTLDTCIAIRTAVIRGGVARLQAGAGIVADSVPEAEYLECLHKLAALETALDAAAPAERSGSPVEARR